MGFDREREDGALLVELEKRGAASEAALLEIAESGGWATGAAARRLVARCAVCAQPLGWRRTDARYCRNACRQRAYRCRLREAVLSGYPRPLRPNGRRRAASPRR